MTKPLTPAMDNVDAWRIGEVCTKAASSEQRVGDPIDRGLILRRLLEENGYGIVKLSAPIPPSAPTEEQIAAAAREIYDEESARPTFGLSETQIATILRKHLLNRNHGGKGT